MSDAVFGDLICREHRKMYFSAIIEDRQYGDNLAKVWMGT
jgi:hypothetical protein